MILVKSVMEMRKMQSRKLSGSIIWLTMLRV